VGMVPRRLKGLGARHASRRWSGRDCSTFVSCAVPFAAGPELSKVGTMAVAVRLGSTNDRAPGHWGGIDPLETLTGSAKHVARRRIAADRITETRYVVKDQAR